MPSHAKAVIRTWRCEIVQLDQILGRESLNATVIYAGYSGEQLGEAVEGMGYKLGIGTIYPYSHLDQQEVDA
jgi:hypothetical protein